MLPFRYAEVHIRMVSLSEAFSGKRVFVTGHTGFKGSWLCAWLIELGADVTGYSLPPPTRPALFTQLRLASQLNHIVGDVRDAASISKAIASARPDYLFHLAAQPIVRSAHDNPSATWATNVMGTVNVLEALRKLKGPCAAVIVTTDKVYGARQGSHAERHPLGASEPYGASKAAAELAVEAWRASFFPIGTGGRPPFPAIAVATARAGNVIGGGDWAADRLVPDVARALRKGKPAILHNPAAIRPWQHVLDPLEGYLTLGAQLRQALALKEAALLKRLSGPFNFGPAPGDHRSVRETTEEMLKHWPGKWKTAAAPRALAEVSVLRLDATKARKVLGWRPKWRFEEAVFRTVTWYRAATSDREAEGATHQQLSDHKG
jgi:CDP-glucose 4,6-dehydratase